MPFITLLMSEKAWSLDPKNRGKDKNETAMVEMISLEYRRVAFKLSLVASDEVARAYNNLMQYLDSIEAQMKVDAEKDPTAVIRLLGKLLLEVRRSMGNAATKLDHWEMLEWFITDVKGLKKQSLAI